VPRYLIEGALLLGSDGRVTIEDLDLNDDIARMLAPSVISSSGVRLSRARRCSC
jgi:hypothetical protein